MKNMKKRENCIGSCICWPERTQNAFLFKDHYANDIHNNSLRVTQTILMYSVLYEDFFYF